MCKKGQGGIKSDPPSEVNLSLKEKYFCNDVGTKTENTPWKIC